MDCNQTNQTNQTNPISQELQFKIASLQDAITKVHPTMPILLKEIHTILKNDPINVTTLSESDIAILVNGLEVQTKTELMRTALKKKATSLKSVTADDL